MTNIRILTVTEITKSAVTYITNSKSNWSYLCLCEMNQKCQITSQHSMV